MTHEAPPLPLTGVLFEVAGRRWSALDAALHGMQSGAWAQLEARLARGLAAERVAPPADDAVEAALVAFRRANGLLAAADLRAWLEARGLTRDDLIAHARRAAAGSAEPADEDLHDTIHAEALLDGTLAACATALARDASMAAAGGQAEPGRSEWVEAISGRAARLPASLIAGADVRARAEAVLAVVAARDAFANAAVTDERLGRLLRQRRLGLTTVRAQQLLVGSRGAAAEAVMCVAHDGASLPEVAGRARAACFVVEDRIDALAPSLRAGLESARPGDLAGPLQDGGAWLVLNLLDRTAPTLENPAVRDLLAAELVELNLQRSVAGSVEWHVDL